MADDTYACKRALRTQVLARRDGLSTQRRTQGSTVLCRQLERLLPARTVAVYAAMGSEPNLAPFATAARATNARIAYPAMLVREAHGQRMQMRAVAAANEAQAPFIADPLCKLAPNGAIDRFPVVAPTDIDLIVVPLVAFDDTGARLGYGGGCYDRYLPTLSPACRIVGAAFAEQRVGVVPASAHDLPLPRIVSA